MKDFEDTGKGSLTLEEDEGDHDSTYITKSKYLRTFKEVKSDFLAGKTRMDVVPAESPDKMAIAVAE